ncbi:uncharacterized protein LOC110115380 [Dendrobium catenatum]|uniref:uncharacterized protein LOC110115380 n=1 Tax=Dendrobium catenatum TaxID=906689 RepID=UPI0010A098C7|nr:uncharacterized protein LOC110115380 [Dendrobium catenatum]
MAAWNTRGFNSPDKTLCCKNLVNKFNLDMLFILETRISPTNSSNSWFLSNHHVFSQEGSFDNFAYASPGRIWLKWNTNTVSFKPLFTSSQLVHGMVSTNSNEHFYIFVVYASNNLEERRNLWNDILEISSSISLPWLILGYFNCCRFSHDKAGRSLLHDNKLLDFQNLIYHIEAHELSSVGHFLTWFNHRTDNPIHIKLDRMLVNDDWLGSYPNSFFVVDDPYISDHSPIVLQQGVDLHLKHRFQFKNYWVSKPEFWDDLISIFSQKFHSSPIHSFYNKLKTLKLKIKAKSWASSTSMYKEIYELNLSQNTIIFQLQASPLDPDLNLALKNTNQKLYVRNADWADWIIQRAKAKWMSCGEDLKFLYSRNNVRHNSNLIKVISTANGTFNSHNEISNAIVQHFQKLFNTPPPPSNQSRDAPILHKLPHTLVPKLVAPISVEEIKNVIFSSPNHSISGPDGYTF